MIAADHPIMMGFEPLVNQRLLPPTFPRYAKIIKREDMVAYFSKLIERIKTVCDVINTTNLHGILVNTFPEVCLDALFFIKFYYKQAFQDIRKFLLKARLFQLCTRFPS